MSSILIADSDKLSTLMTLECCKHKRRHIEFKLTDTGEQCVQLAKQHSFDLIIVDFDLPDCDGITLTKALKRFYNGPVLITTFPEKTLEKIIAKELFPYPLKTQLFYKPLQTNLLSPIIGNLLKNTVRLTKRFACQLPILFIQKEGIQGKRSHKKPGTLLNFGLGGALIQSLEQFNWEKGDQLTLLIEKKTTSLNQQKSNILYHKISTSIVWHKKKTKQFGVKFHEISSHHRKELLTMMKTATEII